MCRYLSRTLAIISSLKGNPLASTTRAFSVMCVSANLIEVDAYGVKVLLQSFPETLTPLLRMGKLVGSQMRRCGTKIFLSVSSSQHSGERRFQRTCSTAEFSLGTRYEHLAKQSVLSEPLTDDLGVILSRGQYDTEHRSLVTGLMDPFRERWSNVNAYRFYFGEFVAYVKVDRRPFPPDLKLFALAIGPEVLVASRDFAKSKDFGGDEAHGYWSARQQQQEPTLIEYAHRAVTHKPCAPGSSRAHRRHPATRATRSRAPSSPAAAPAGWRPGRSA